MIRSFLARNRDSDLGYSFAVAARYLVDDYNASLQEKMFNRIEKNREYEFELLKIMLNQFSSLEKEWKEKAFELANERNDFAICLGISIERKFASFDSSLQQELRERINANNVIAGSYYFSRL